MMGKKSMEKATGLTQEQRIDRAMRRAEAERLARLEVEGKAVKQFVQSVIPTMIGALPSGDPMRNRIPKETQFDSIPVNLSMEDKAQEEPEHYEDDEDERRAKAEYEADQEEEMKHAGFGDGPEYGEEEEEPDEEEEP